LAYLDPETLTCPGCAKSAAVTWVIGEGPDTKPGAPPDYIDLLETGPWVSETTNTTPVWAGKITCPDCEETVLARP